MIRDDAAGRIRQILGFRTDLFNESLDAIREAQEDAEAGELGFLPWFLRRTAGYTLPPGEKDLALPDGFIREYDHEKYALWLEGAGPARRVPYFSPSRAGTLKSNRPVYWVDENVMKLDRRFDVEIRAEFLYYKRDTVLNSNVENSWLQHGSKYIIGAAGLKLAGVRDEIARETFETMQQSGAGNLLRADTAYRTGSHKPQFGDGLDRDFRDTDSGSIRYNDYDLGYE